SVTFEGFKGPIDALIEEVLMEAAVVHFRLHPPGCENRLNSRRHLRYNFEFLSAVFANLQLDIVHDRCIKFQLADRTQNRESQFRISGPIVVLAEKSAYGPGRPIHLYQPQETIENVHVHILIARLSSRLPGRLHWKSCEDCVQTGGQGFSEDSCFD